MNGIKKLKHDKSRSNFFNFVSNFVSKFHFIEIKADSMTIGNDNKNPIYMINSAK